MSPDSQAGKTRMSPTTKWSLVIPVMPTSYWASDTAWIIASQLVYRDMSDLLARLEEPWDEIEIPEEQRTKSSLTRTELDLYWFGAVGVDPTI